MIEGQHLGAASHINETSQREREGKIGRKRGDSLVRFKPSSTVTEYEEVCRALGASAVLTGAYQTSAQFVRVDIWHLCSELITPMKIQQAQHR